MCAHVLTTSIVHDGNNDEVVTEKQATPTSYKGRRGRLCGNRAARPWRIQGGPSIFGTASQN